MCDVDRILLMRKQINTFKRDLVDSGQFLEQLPTLNLEREDRTKSNSIGVFIETESSHWKITDVSQKLPQL